MLLRFRFSNFRSFRTEQELSLIAGSFSDLPEAVLRPPGLGEGVLPVAAIYGANGSGKTNVIRALQFMSTAARDSHRHWQPDGRIPWEPFRADADSQTEPSRFVADFLIDNTRHQYGFILDSQEILEEWLFVYPNGKKQSWFRRVHREPMTFGTKMPGENKTIESLTRKNSLFLSAAAQNNHEALLPVYRWLSHSLSFVIGERAWLQRMTAALCQDEEYRRALVQLICLADLGIADLRVREEKLPERAQKALAAFCSILKIENIIGPQPDTQAQIQLLHRIGTQTVPLDANQESDGTVAYLALLGPVIQALKTGGTVCIDELDASLHPLLAIQITRLFNGSSQNPRGAQLIFSTHDTNLLSSGVLRRDQVWFTEKNIDGSTHLYPLSDFKPRRHESLENGYLQGRYGAIPFINPEAFLRCFEA